MRPAPRTPALLPTLACFGLIALAGLASCARTQSVPVTAAATAEPWPATPPTIDISNFNGRIDLVVNDRLTAPSVRATAWSCRGEVDVSQQATIDQLGVGATLENGVYRVVASRQDGLPSQVGVHLSIAVPSAADITVYNRGGPVKILNASAGVQVENGRGPVGSGDDGAWLGEEHEPWIQLRTAGAIDKPVALVTDLGDVAILLGPAARGAINLQAPAGTVRANARVGTIDDFKATQHTISARYNGGTNPVLLRTENGDARALLIAEPEDYALRMW